MTYNSANSTICIDIGGSHISGALFDRNHSDLLKQSIKSVPINSAISASEFTESLIGLINDIYSGPKNKMSVGISIPGPFDYKNGISKITGLHKYENLFGLDLKQVLKGELKLNSNYQILFINDAIAYILGEYWFPTESKNTLGVVLGTGFGSAFLKNGVPVKAMPGVTENGFLYNAPYKGSTAEACFSTRWFQKRFKELSGKEISGVKELLKSGSDLTNIIFEEFGQSLAGFLVPYLEAFKADELIIGGNISKSHHLFLPYLKKRIEQAGLSTHISISSFFEKAPLLGLASLFLPEFINRGSQIQNPSFLNYWPAEELSSPKKMKMDWRKSTQPILPLKKPKIIKGEYDIYPSFEIPKGRIKTGYKSLVQWILKNKNITIDGFGGIFWNSVKDELDTIFRDLGITVRWFDVSAALKSQEEILELTESSFGPDSSIFGNRYGGTLSDFYDEEALVKIKPDPNADLNILTGCGSALCDWDASLIYLDLPKNEYQFRMRAGTLTNLGIEKPGDPSNMYKRAYFIDWIVLNKHKKELLTQIDVIADGQNLNDIAWMEATYFKNALSEMAQNVFRVRPWFEPGVWGGQWIKKNIPALPQEVINYAWSFELIVPENGILFETNGKLLEVSFDFLMFAESKKILGKAQAVFKDEFPIRFDFLDTFDGGSLSVQCHPRPDYIHDNFGENFTQDETYYILDAGEDAKVYLGFQETIDRAQFREVLENSQQQNKAINIEKYVQSHPAKKHDLFLIPNGTVHASGKNNLVLEISSTPYIFTFKMYDWMRLDLDGKQRPINIEHAFKNLYFDRKGERIKAEFLSKPELLDWGHDWQIYHLPTHTDHFYDVERIEFKSEVTIKTENQCHVCMLVEGTSIILETKKGLRQQFNYAETFVVPAAANSYRLINEGDKKARVIKAFIKKEINIPPNLTLR